MSSQSFCDCGISECISMHFNDWYNNIWLFIVKLLSITRLHYLRIYVKKRSSVKHSGLFLLVILLYYIICMYLTTFDQYVLFILIIIGYFKM
uniref:Ovule protein n=1 Tax=Heterorhabditis bacteriophora TaxID=37862 RepID=A0A1I7WFP0_HETBA